ncbi:MAG: hypothetical protein DRI90_26475 [Deltaproteobacteria bacterium]|nr:MAG: hypothetical protein DRI90_26475 [Deltaproteobacteria bacterium]
MSRAFGRGERVQWDVLRRHSDYQGLWVALNAVRYDSGIPLEGELVDVDEDLAVLCARIQSAEDTACAILFCEDKSSTARGAVRSG